MGMKVKNALAVYLHIPFCRVRCPYCDFNTYSGIQSLVPAYVEALCRVITREGAASGFHAARTVYFGGGTPSLLEPKHVAQLIEAVNVVLAAHCRLRNHPGSQPGYSRRRAALPDFGLPVSIASLLACRASRIGSSKCWGVTIMPRKPKRALHLARQAGFENVSLDLMYAVPNQSLADWQHDVARALALAPEHLSLYCLTVEASTPFARWVTNGRIKLPSDDIAADMYAYASEYLAVAGYEHYEISNWALPGGEGQHNQIYWRYEPYLGLGAGAHGYLHGTRTEEIHKPREYIERALCGESTVLRQENISEPTAMEESIFLNLRLMQRGILRQEFAARFGTDPVTLLGRELAELTRANLVSIDEQLHPPHAKRLLLG